MRDRQRLEHGHFRMPLECLHDYGSREVFMMTITIGISDEHARKLKHLADHAGVSADELIRETVQNWLERSDQDFAMAAAYVIEKNSELYRRLAR